MLIARRQFLKGGALATSGAANGAVSGGLQSQVTPPPATAANRWNVLFVIADQHQGACMGNEGHPQAITPNLDRLAKEGVRFAANYAQNPICTPSRMSVYTGQYCHNHGYYGLSGHVPPMSLPSFLLHFRRHGYKTAALGKIHVPDRPSNWLEPHCDFFTDTYDGFYGPPDPRAGANAYMSYLKGLGLYEKEDSLRLPEFPGDQQQEGRPSDLPYQHSIEGWCVANAISFMESCKDQPFCIQVSLPKPHQCYTPAKRFWDMYAENLELPRTLYNSAAHRPPHFQRMVEALKTRREWLIEPKTFEAGCRRVWRAYLACITHNDYAVGELLDYLEGSGKAGNTIVIYGADHGGYAGTHGIPEKAPGICSEAVCRVPFLWRVPGVTKAGHVCRELTENVDIASTIPALAGLPPMDATDGRDITSLLRGGNTPVREVAVTENVWSKALRWRQWRFVHYPMKMFGSDVGELYDLEKDPDETRNLYHDKEGGPVVNQCRRLLLEWTIETTRFKTANGAPREIPQEALRAEDGSESNRGGIPGRLRRGYANYI